MTLTENFTASITTDTNYEKDKNESRAYVQKIRDTPAVRDDGFKPGKKGNITLNEVDPFFKSDYNTYSSEAFKWDKFDVNLENLPGSIYLNGHPVDADMVIIIKTAMNLGNSKSKDADIEHIKSCALEIDKQINEIINAIIPLRDNLADYAKHLEKAPWTQLVKTAENKHNNYRTEYLDQQKNWFDNMLHPSLLPKLRYFMDTTEKWRGQVYQEIDKCSGNDYNKAQYLVNFWKAATDEFKNWLKDFDALKIAENPASIDDAKLKKLDEFQNKWNNKVFKPFMTQK